MFYILQECKKPQVSKTVKNLLIFGEENDVIQFNLVHITTYQVRDTGATQ